MTVPVTEFERLNPTGAGCHGLIERVGSRGGESGLAILFPHTVQRLESRCREGVPSPIEPLVQVGTASRRGMRSSLLEIPSKFIERFGLDWRHQLIPHGLFGALTDVRKLRWHHNPERPRRQCLEKRGMAQEEYAELVQPRVGDDVDDHAAAAQMDANRQPVWEDLAQYGPRPRRREQGMTSESRGVGARGMTAGMRSGARRMRQASGA